MVKKTPKTLINLKKLNNQNGKTLEKYI